MISQSRDEAGALLSFTDFVVDAGVAIKWYVPEIHEREAKRFLDPTYMLHVPELFRQSPHSKRARP